MIKVAEDKFVAKSFLDDADAFCYYSLDSRWWNSLPRTKVNTQSRCNLLAVVASKQIKMYYY